MKASPSVLRPGDKEAGVQPYRFDDDLIAQAGPGPEARWRVSRPAATMVVIGRGGNLALEVNLDACRERSIPVFRRNGGGCSVVLDPGNLIVSIVYPTRSLQSPHPFFSRATDWLLVALHKLGIPEARRDGISDLVAGDRKIGGSCIHLTRSRVYFSATILVNPDVSAISACLRHPPREPDYRKGRSHEDFLRGISSLLPSRATNEDAGQTPDLATKLQDFLAQGNP